MNDALNDALAQRLQKGIGVEPSQEPEVVDCVESGVEGAAAPAE